MKLLILLVHPHNPLQRQRERIDLRALEHRKDAQLGKWELQTQ